jgi:hypothetical protein
VRAPEDDGRVPELGAVADGTRLRHLGERREAAEEIEAGERVRRGIAPKREECDAPSASAVRRVRPGENAATIAMASAVVATPAREIVRTSAAEPARNAKRSSAVPRDAR